MNSRGEVTRGFLPTVYMSTCLPTHRGKQKQNILEMPILFMEIHPFSLSKYQVQ